MAISAQDQFRRNDGRSGYTPMQDPRDTRQPPVMGSYSPANIPRGMGAVDPQFASAQKSAQSTANAMQQYNSQPRQPSTRQTFPSAEGPMPTGALQRTFYNANNTAGSSDRVRGGGMREAENPYTLNEGNLVTRGQRKNNPTMPVVDSSALGGVASSGQMGRGSRAGRDTVLDNSIPDDQLPDNLLKFDGSNFGAASDRGVQALIGGDSRTSGIRGDQNFLTRADGSRLYASDYGSNVNTMDMGAANSAMAEANAIRQRQIDAQPERRRGPQAPPDMASILANVDTSGLSASAGRSMRQGVIDSTIGAYESNLDRQSRERITQQDNAAGLMMQQMRNDGGLQQAMAGDAAAMERLQTTLNSFSVDGIVNMLSAEGMDPAIQSTLLESLMRRLDAEEAEESGDDEAARQEIIANANSYAEGGLVDPVIPMGAMAGMGGEYGQAPQQPMQAEVQEYQRYVAGAKGMGIPAVPFEEFLQMKEGAAALGGGGGEPAMPQMVNQPQGALAFAEGGMVPDPMDVSGDMVIDPNPMAGTDSIPAMIDGQVPAKLDSGEFVLPEDVTRFFGTKKLNDMIQQARSAMQEANASPGPAM